MPYLGQHSLDVGWLAIQGDEVTGYDWNGPELKEEDIQAILDIFSAAEY